MMELVCPAGTPAALRAAVGAGAHSVYCGFADETNARNFPGLNFSREDMAEAVEHAHRAGSRVLVAINTFPRAGAEALKIEGRQRSRSYVAEVVRSFRAAVEAEEAGRPVPEGTLARLSEGQTRTTGAYAKSWR